MACAVLTQAVTLKYLLDTSILSEPLKPKAVPQILANLQAYAKDCACPSPVLHELFFGACRLPASARQDKILAYLYDVVLPVFPILPYDAAAASWHALRRAELMQQGRTPPFVDGQIAAIAQTQGLMLVTRNAKDFVPFGIAITDWCDV